MDKLEREVRPVARRDRGEKFLPDLDSSGTDLEDVRRRLASIQDKMRRIESDHSDEITRLKAFQIEQEKRVWDTVRDRDRINNEKLLLESQVRDLRNQVLDRDMKLSASNTLSDDIQKELKELKTRLIKMESDLNQKVALVNSLEKCCSDFRSDRDEFEQQRSKLQQTMSEKESELTILRSKIDTMRRHSTDKTASGVEELRRVLQEKVEEVASLTATVRRECEERTQLLIELSTMKQGIIHSSTGKRNLSSGSILPDPGGSLYSAVATLTVSASADARIFPDPSGTVPSDGDANSVWMRKAINVRRRRRSRHNP